MDVGHGVGVHLLEVREIQIATQVEEEKNPDAGGHENDYEDLSRFHILYLPGSSLAFAPRTGTINAHQLRQIRTRQR